MTVACCVQSGGQPQRCSGPKPLVRAAVRVLAWRCAGLDDGGDMKTEPQTSKVAFAGKGAPEPVAGTPLTVYLDQWCWSHLVMDRAGSPLDESERGVYRRMRAAVAAGRARFVLSQAHYRENWARDHVDARWDTAVVMAELSGFHTISSSGLEEWDAACAIAAHHGLDRPPSPEVLGWGLAHCLTGREVRAQIIDQVTGRQPAWEDLSPEQLADLADLEDSLAFRFELAILARRDPELEPHGLNAFSPIPDATAARLHQANLDLADHFRQHGRSLSRVKDTIAGAAFKDSVDLLDAAARQLGVSPMRYLTDVAGDGGPGTSERLHKFMAEMPVSQVYNGLRIAAHRKESFKFTQSDVVDFWTVATVMPFVDVFVADNRTYNLIQEGDLAAGHETLVVRRLRDVADHLAAAMVQ